MAGLVVAGLLNPANSGSYSALLSAAGKQGTPPAAYTPPTYTPPPGPILVDAAAVAPADAPAAASALDPNLPETDYDGVLVGTNCQPLTTKSSPGDHLTEDQIDTAWQSAYVSNSPCCQSLRASGQSPTRIAYVNGIDTDRATQCVTLQKIANMTCAPVLGVHNATNGTVKDLWQSHQDKNLIDKARAGKAFPTFDGRNPAVDTLTDIMTNSVISGEPTALWAHSQGGDILSLASYQADTELKVGGYPSGISGLQATTMASAAQNYPPDLSATHFINIQDFVPTWLGIGKNPKSDPANTGPNQNVIRFEGAPGASNPTFLSDQDMTNMLKKNFSIGPFGNLQYQDSAPPVSIKAFHDVDTTYLNAIRAKDGGCPPDD
ncbi:MAG TPA: hypothetical protein VFC39_07300 [Acidobacteriaceae bacterium]|nr:hypothetical protein [Acidobacteriaceae bacterium]